jgi:hypothetical protein
MMTVVICYYRDVGCDDGTVVRMWYRRGAMESGEMVRRCVHDIIIIIIIIKLNSVALVCERTIPTERPPLLGKVSDNFCG